jgi:hypothetical protein
MRKVYNRRKQAVRTDEQAVRTDEQAVRTKQMSRQ